VLGLIAALRHYTRNVPHTIMQARSKAGANKVTDLIELSHRLQIEMQTVELKRALRQEDAEIHGASVLLSGGAE
jgi:hypothetical protein